jgi:hypothetical protein
MNYPAASWRGITRKYPLYPLTLTLSYQGRGDYTVTPPQAVGVLKNVKVAWKAYRYIGRPKGVSLFDMGEDFEVHKCASIWLTKRFIDKKKVYLSIRHMPNLHGIRLLDL